MHRVFICGLIIVAFHFCFGILGTLGNDFGNFEALDMSQFTVPLDGFRIEGTQTVGKILPCVVLNVDLLVILCC
jgi:hypothetical protein